jgi:hypothetical protein
MKKTNETKSMPNGQAVCSEDRDHGPYLPKKSATVRKNIRTGGQV